MYQKNLTKVFNFYNPFRNILEMFVKNGVKINTKKVFLRLEENNDEAENETQKPAPQVGGADLYYYLFLP